jgi:molybdopterin/thiamine biosynthesis adenylyltransferase
MSEDNELRFSRQLSLPQIGSAGQSRLANGTVLVVGLGSDLEGQLWAYDGLTGSTRAMKIKRRPDCPVCNCTLTTGAASPGSIPGYHLGD